MSTQARLLRVLESGEFMKVGSSKVQKTDVRVVAATNVNLTQAIAEGRFREDLYYRLNTVLSRYRLCVNVVTMYFCCSVSFPQTLQRNTGCLLFS